MAKNPRKETFPTKKHIARVERERIQTRNITLISVAVVLVVLIILGYGILNQTVLQQTRPVAVVNGDKIRANTFEAQTRYARYTLVNNATSTYQFAQMFGSDANTLMSFAQQLQQYQAQLVPNVMGEQVLNRLIEDQLIKQEAQRRGITVSKQEVGKAFEEAFRFFPDGTATPTATLEPMPTSTLSAQQLTLIPPTLAPTETPTIDLTQTAEAQALTPTADTNTAEAPTETPTQAATSTPEVEPSPTLAPTETATPTPYTMEAYETQYAETVNQFDEQFKVTEKDLYYVIETQLYRQKLMEAITADTPRTSEQVWALHILVEEEQLAKDILAQLEQGGDWGQLASTYSTDSSNKNKGGDLGWFGKGRMVPEFEEAAFALGVGETSEPIQSQFGYHIIRVLGHEERPLSDEEYLQTLDAAFQTWLDEQREKSEIEINDFWMEIVPTEPTLPVEIEQFIMSAMQQSAPAPGIPPIEQP
jgi:parvulin-like peptidyl-prolyl isomerase